MLPFFMSLKKKREREREREERERERERENFTYRKIVGRSCLGARQQYNLVVDEDVKKPTNQTNKQTCSQPRICNF